jgi:hypothetical protein
VIQWDQPAIDAIVQAHVRQVAAQAKPVIERRIDGAFPLNMRESPVELYSSDPKAMVMEYGDGEQQPQPWGLTGLADMGRGQ